MERTLLAEDQAWNRRLALLRWLLIAALLVLGRLLYGLNLTAADVALLGFSGYNLALTAAVYLPHRFSYLLGYVTVSLDFLLATVLVWVSGGIASPFVPIYLVFLAVTAVRYGPAYGIVTAILALSLYLPLGLLHGDFPALLPVALGQGWFFLAIALALGLLPQEERRRQVKHLEERTEQLFALLQSTKGAETTAKGEDPLAPIARLAQRLSRAEIGGLLIVEQDLAPGQEIRGRLLAADDSSVREATFLITPGQGGVAEQVLREEKAVAAAGGPGLAMNFWPTFFPSARSFLGLPVQGQRRLLGQVFAVNRRGESAFNAQDQALLSSLADQAALVLENRQLLAEIRASFVSTIESLVTAIEAKSPSTRGHSEGVIKYAVAIAQEMGLPADQAERVRVAAVLHDLGKIGIPDDLLNRAGPLSDSEWAIMKRHPRLGFNIADPLDPEGEILFMIYHHHERYDGTGYPDGLAGEKIPLGACIIAAADSYEAMTAVRPYQRSKSPGEALEEIRQKAGAQFDPVVAEAFLRVLERERKKR